MREEWLLFIDNSFRLVDEWCQQLLSRYYLGVSLHCSVNEKCTEVLFMACSVSVPEVLGNCRHSGRKEKKVLLKGDGRRDRAPSHLSEKSGRKEKGLIELFQEGASHL